MWDAGARYSGSGRENHFQIWQFQDHPPFPEMKGYVFYLLGTWYRAFVLRLPLKMISLFFLSVCFKLFLKGARSITWYLFLFSITLCTSPFFYFELICKPPFVTKWVHRDGVLMDFTGLGSTLFWSERSQHALVVPLHHRRSWASRHWSFHN